MSFLKSPFIRRGLPVMGIMAGATFFLKKMQDIKYDLKKMKIGYTNEEADAILRRHNVTEEDLIKENNLEAEKLKLQEKDMDKWQNIRGPRPWENSKTLQEQLRAKQGDDADTKSDTSKEIIGQLEFTEQNLKHVMNKYEEWKEKTLKLLDDFADLDLKSGTVEERYNRAFACSDSLVKPIHEGNRISRVLLKFSKAEHLMSFHEEIKATNRELSKINTKLRNANLEMWQYLAKHKSQVISKQ